MYYVYVLSSSIKKWIYVGCADNLKRRFRQHQNGEVSSTKSYKPFRLIYYEAYLNKTDAITREYKIKHHSQTRELLYEQLKKTINLALSSNG